MGVGVVRCRVVKEKSPEVIALKAQIAAMQAEQEKLKAQLLSRPKLSMKVSEKGALSVYGMGRFPVTLYAEQWATLLDPETAKSITEFIAQNKGKLSTKADKQAREDEAEAKAKAERIAAYEKAKAEEAARAAAKAG